MGKLTGKVAVIMGANGGLGIATAKLFVSEGAYVYITGRRQKELDEAVKEIGSNVTGVAGDVSKLADLDRLYATVKAAHGHIDVLVANAGLGTLDPRQDHGRGLRLDIRRQCERNDLHSSKSPPSDRSCCTT